jgi:hypothetical protein
LSFNKFYRKQWIGVVYAEAVKLFHEARKDSENEHITLDDLARRAANTAFQENASQIVGDKETMARAFMAHCREHFGTEIQSAIAEQAQADIEQTQIREREELVA